MIDAATKLPLRHLSVRVPWHDNGWNGTICQHPIENADCLVLKNVHKNRKDTKEEANSGRSWSELEQEDFPACVGERAGFMAPFEYSRMISHPYAATSDAHNHFRPTRFRYPMYSAACIPFRWTLSSMAEDIA